jgi:hypothetical protein
MLEILCDWKAGCDAHESRFPGSLDEQSPVGEWNERVACCGGRLLDASKEHSPPPDKTACMCGFDACDDHIQRRVREDLVAVIVEHQLIWGQPKPW